MRARSVKPLVLALASALPLYKRMAIGRTMPLLVVAVLLGIGLGWGLCTRTLPSDTPYAGTVSNVNGTQTVACVYPPGVGPDSPGDWCGHVVRELAVLPTISEGMHVHALFRQVGELSVLVVTP